MAALDDAPCHGAALAAQSDESDAHQPASIASDVSPCAATHSPTNESTFWWYAEALCDRDMLWPVPGCSLMTNRSDAVNMAPIWANVAGSDRQTRSCSAT